MGLFYVSSALRDPLVLLGCFGVLGLLFWFGFAQDWRKKAGPPVRHKGALPLTEPHSNTERL